MKKHFTPKYFANPVHPITISVIGCGGTGSLLLTRLARINHELLQLGHAGIFVTCYDDDIVEEHNVGRQSFVLNEVGINKAFVLISKINAAYGFDWKASPERITEESEVLNANIIITCVDKVDVRMQINNAIQEIAEKDIYGRDYEKSYYWIDCGNGKDFGQVVLATTINIEQPKGVDNTTSKLKSVVDIYGDLHEYNNEEIQGIESCSFLDSILKQDLFINDEIALAAAKVLRKLLKSPYINSNGFVINQNSGKSQPFLIS